MKANLHVHAGQHMAMTPQLLQSIRLLQLSSLELEQEVRQALEQNVMLEPTDDADDEDDPAVAADEPAPIESAAQSDAEVTGADPAALERVEADFDWSSADSWSGGEPQDGEDGPWEARHAAPAQQDARLAALEQLQLTVATPREARIVAAILEAIDDNGYLEQPLDGVGLMVDLDPPASMPELEAALAKVQAVEPSGYGARDLRECLLLQLRALPAATPARDLAEFLISACLERLASGDLADVRQALGVDAVQMRDAVSLVLALNPKPASSLAAAAEVALPDLVVTGTRGGWKVELNAERLPRVRVNRLYERLLNQGANHRGMRDQLQEARWLVRGLEMRHETLIRTARVVFERQHAFLDRGEEGMVSLTLREVAEAIGMHESTVCRVTSNKWVQTPWGVYELKAFFPSHIAGNAGVSDTSGTAVKAMIRRIIDTENHKAPLCDGAIAALLARNGVRVARRTVAKYREAMRIAPAKERTAAPRRRAVPG